MNETDPIGKCASDYMEHLAEINAKIEGFDEALALLKDVDIHYFSHHNSFCPVCGAGHDSWHFPDCRLAAFLKSWGKKKESA